MASNDLYKTLHLLHLIKAAKASEEIPTTALKLYFPSLSSFRLFKFRQQKYFF